MEKPNNIFKENVLKFIDFTTSKIKDPDLSIFVKSVANETKQKCSETEDQEKVMENIFEYLNKISILQNNIPFTKTIKTDKYIVLYNHLKGFEASQGINGNPDPFILDAPSMIDIGIMGHCSNNCEICYQGNVNIPNMTFDNFKKIIDQCKGHINQVALGGKGDPNKHEDFEKILQYCRVNSVVPNYTTSGNGLTEEEAYITKMYCGAVAISMIPENK